MQIQPQEDSCDNSQTRNYHMSNNLESNTMFANYMNKTVRMTSLPTPPYVMYNNGSWCGIIVDMMEIVSKMCNFSYIVSHNEDETWGRDLGNLTYNGMVGTVQRGEADVGMNVLSQAFDRSQVVDYGIPLPQPMSSTLFDRLP